MTGNELILPAGRLAANPALGDAEARLRSAVSRAYYGVYHVVRAFVASLGGAIPKNATGHFELSRMLWNSRQEFARDAASRRDDLRRERNRADYDLDSSSFPNQINAVECVELADEVRLAIERCQQEPALTAIHVAISSS